MKIMLKLTSNPGPIYIRVEKIAAITPYPQGSPFLTRIWLSGNDDPFCVYEDTGTVLRMLNANDQNEPAAPVPALRSGDLAGISETPRANAGDWFDSLDFLVIISDPETYETQTIKGRQIFEVWAAAQWTNGLADAPDDQLANFREHVTNPNNWYGSDSIPSNYGCDIGGEAGSISFYRLTHLQKTG